uniref:Uncharacterized protein n=1 Tax=Micrurus lemniscatus lemniscatus TaxID=129467 RepID=A0A2D4IN81_MICLE
MVALFRPEIFSHNHSLLYYSEVGITSTYYISRCTRGLQAATGLQQQLEPTFQTLIPKIWSVIFPVCYKLWGVGERAMGRWENRKENGEAESNIHASRDISRP